MSLAAPAAIVAALMLAAGPADAATVRATTGGSGAYGVAEGTVTYAAAAGEANTLEASLVAGTRGVVELRDDGAPITVGARCTSVTVHVARCDAAADFVIVNADLGDRDDVATVDAPLYGIVLGGDGNDTLTGGCQLTGGPGDDTLTGCANTSSSLNHTLLGGPGNDTIQGGDGSEIIDGGGGRDVLSGGAGTDTITDGDGPHGEAGGDLIDGGPGDRDSVSYSNRTVPVRVDLALPDAAQGAAGEDDRVRGVEDVYGGAAGDELLGDDGANRLDAGPGADVVGGRGGDDQLLGGAGPDRVDAGAGNDEIVTRDLYRDSVACGPGGDTLLADAGDAVAPGCEAKATPPVDLIPGRYRLGVRDRRTFVRLACPDLDELSRTVSREFEPCDFVVTLRLRVRGRMVVAGRITCRSLLCPPMVITRAAWEMLLARRSVTGVAEFARLPRAGALRHTERVVVKVSRR